MIVITEAERAALVAEGVELGFTQQVMENSFDRVLAAANSLQGDRDAAAATALNDAIATLQTLVTLATQGRAWVAANAPAGNVKDATLQAIDAGILRAEKRIARLQASGS